MNARLSSFVFPLAAVLLLAGPSPDRAADDDEIKIEFDPSSMPYVTACHLAHIRAKLRKMVGDDELPRMKVVIEGAGRVRATLPEFRDSTYSIQRFLSMHASDWPSWIGWEKGEPGAGVSWAISRVVVVCRIFELDGVTVEIPVHDEMSYVETSRVLMAIRHGMVALRPGCIDRERPTLSQIFAVRREANGDLSISTQAEPSHRWGPIFFGALRNGVFEIRGYGHWDS